MNLFYFVNYAADLTLIVLGKTEEEAKENFQKYLDANPLAQKDGWEVSGMCQKVNNKIFIPVGTEVAE